MRTVTRTLKRSGEEMRLRMVEVGSVRRFLAQSTAA